jgi:hypothetical protein
LEDPVARIRESCREYVKESTSPTNLRSKSDAGKMRRLGIWCVPDGADAADAASADKAQDGAAVSEADSQPQKGGKKKAGKKTTQKLRKPDKRTERAVVKSKKKA